MSVAILAQVCNRSGSNHALDPVCKGPLGPLPAGGSRFLFRFILVFLRLDKMAGGSSRVRSSSGGGDWVAAKVRVQESRITALHDRLASIECAVTSIEQMLRCSREACLMWVSSLAAAGDAVSSCASQASASTRATPGPVPGRGSSTPQARAQVDEPAPGRGSSTPQVSAQHVDKDTPSPPGPAPGRGSSTPQVRAQVKEPAPGRGLPTPQASAQDARTEYFEVGSAASGQGDLDLHNSDDYDNFDNLVNCLPDPGHDLVAESCLPSDAEVVASLLVPPFPRVVDRDLRLAPDLAAIQAVDAVADAVGSQARPPGRQLPERPCPPQVHWQAAMIDIKDTLKSKARGAKPMLLSSLGASYSSYWGVPLDIEADFGVDVSVFLSRWPDVFELLPLGGLPAVRLRSPQMVCTSSPHQDL